MKRILDEPVKNTQDKKQKLTSPNDSIYKPSITLLRFNQMIPTIVNEPELNCGFMKSMSYGNFPLSVVYCDGMMDSQRKIIYDGKKVVKSNGPICESSDELIMVTNKPVDIMVTKEVSDEMRKWKFLTRFC